MVSYKVGIWFYRFFLPFILLINLSVALGISFGDIHSASSDLTNTYFGFTSFISFLKDLDFFGDMGSTLINSFTTLAKVSGFGAPDLISNFLTPDFWNSLGYFVSISLVQPLAFVVVLLIIGIVIFGFVCRFFVSFVRLLNGYYNLPINHVIEFPDLVTNTIRSFIPLML